MCVYVYTFVASVSVYLLTGFCYLAQFPEVTGKTEVMLSWQASCCYRRPQKDIFMSEIDDFFEEKKVFGMLGMIIKPILYCIHSSSSSSLSSEFGSIYNDNK